MRLTLEQIREKSSALKNAAYLECKEATLPCTIIKGDSKEIREEKKARRAAIWEGYDRTLESIKTNELYESWVLDGELFFEEIESNQDVIGWSWKRSSIPKECDICESLVGNYRKGIRKPYPAHVGCTCHLGKIFLETDFKE